MSIFDNILGNWIQIIDEQNEITIENYSYATGVNEKIGKIYDLKSSFMVFPNGKLKCNTLLGGW